MSTPISIQGRRTFYLKDNRVRQLPAEAELARITYREGKFEAELVVNVQLYYWGLAQHEGKEVGDDMLQPVLTARIYSHHSSQEPIAMMIIQSPWRLATSFHLQTEISQWLTEWCEKAIFLGLLREDAWEKRGVLKPVLEKIAEASNFLKEALREAKKERLRLAPDARTLLLNA